MIEIKGLRKSYGQTLVLQNLSLEVPAGRIQGVLGHNGAGKSTLIRCIIGEEEYTGSITLEGRPLLELWEENPGHLAVVPDEPFVYPYLSGWEFVRFVIEFKGLRFDDYADEVKRRFEQFEVWADRQALCRSYSLGMKKKVYLISQLVLRPRFLLLDEPTNGLDVKSIVELRSWLHELAQAGSALIVTSHNLDFMSRTSDAIVLLRRNEAALIINDPGNQDLEGLFLDSLPPSL